jgi:uncharacterized protein YecT (DUF1311 family)
MSMRQFQVWGVTAGLIAGVMSYASAQAPAFDCAKASSTVEKMICRDADLAALDRRLDVVYKAAAAKATGTMAATLRAEQRGWISGRNECWKTGPETPSYLTVSWTVNSVRGCVEAQYKLRTSDLQASWRLLDGRTVSYACQNNPANEVIATYFATDPPTARVERGDQTVTLWQVPAASGAKYEGPNVSLWNKGNEVAVSWLNTATGATEELTCRTR